MNSKPKGPLILSLLIITVGVGWLLTVQGVAPGINWVWTMGLGVIGVLTFVICSGLDKVSVVVGPFFLISSLLSILRQQKTLSIDTELPVLVIALGTLLLVAQSSWIPAPPWALPVNRKSPS